MNFASEIYKGRGYFGGYPNAMEFEELLSNGITLFVDLTTPRERNFLPFVYTSRLPKEIAYVNFPIFDNSIPKNHRHFLYMIHEIALHLQDKKKVYIHCKGGHGRSGIVVASLLCLLYRLPPSEALRLCTLFHSYRPNLKQKWKNVACPQLHRQQKYVQELFFFPKHLHSDSNIHKVDTKFIQETIGSERLLQRDRICFERLHEKEASNRIIYV